MAPLLCRGRASRLQLTLRLLCGADRHFMSVQGGSIAWTDAQTLLLLFEVLSNDSNFFADLFFVFFFQSEKCWNRQSVSKGVCRRCRR